MKIFFSFILSFLFFSCNKYYSKKNNSFKTCELYLNRQDFTNRLSFKIIDVFYDDVMLKNHERIYLAVSDDEKQDTAILIDITQKRKNNFRAIEEILIFNTKSPIIFHQKNKEDCRNFYIHKNTINDVFEKIYPKYKILIGYVYTIY